MTEKLKRKNDEPIPRRYWWIFGILAILLLIGLRFPIRLRVSYELNSIFYILIGISCLLAMVRFIRRFHWRQGVVILMLCCIVLTGLNIKAMGGVYLPLFETPCRAKSIGIFTNYDCKTQMGCYVGWAEYVGVRGMPIVVRTSEYWNGYCILF
jgi:hypothetical protein